MALINPASAVAKVAPLTATDAAVVELRRALPHRVRLGAPMSRCTTFHIGGRADVLALPRNEDELRIALDWADRHSLPRKVLGNGSNILVSDRGVRGLLVKLTPNFSTVEFNSHGLIVGAGAKLGRVLQEAMARGWSGLESLVGIPGTLGGALATNAGTDIGSIGDLVQDALVMDACGTLRSLQLHELAYRYRYSSLPSSGLIVLGARLSLTAADPADIKAKMDRLKVKRSSRQPLTHRSAGSVFKNPEAIAAGKLLDRAGAKGMCVGDAEVSHKHANFIINRGQAKACDVRALIEQLQTLVLRTYGIELEPEVEFVGEW